LNHRTLANLSATPVSTVPPIVGNNGAAGDVAAVDSAHAVFTMLRLFTTLLFGAFLVPSVAIFLAAWCVLSAGKSFVSQR